MIKAHFHDIRSELLKEISFANKSLKIAVAWFTNNELFDALVMKCKAKIPVELIIVKDSINLRQLGLDFNQFISEGGVLYFGDADNLMHHKFCIIDDNVLINGSYNWTYWAEDKNKENITVLKDEIEVLKGFEEEFRKLISTRNPIQNIGAEMLNESPDDENFFNLKNIRLNEYISSAIDLGNRGHQELSNKIFEEVNKLNPINASKVLQVGIASNNPVIKKIYQTLTVQTIMQPKETTYENFCSNIADCIRTGNYLDAINQANACEAKFPGRFSVHVYSGDAKLKLNDKEGSDLEYRTALTALNHNYSKNSKIIYYNKNFNDIFFPSADIYLKLGDKQKAIKILEDAILEYKKVNTPTELIKKAENYLTMLNNNQTPERIE
jgi:tetratricopeptide (TPR) repeat protein